MNTDDFLRVMDEIRAELRKEGVTMTGPYREPAVNMYDEQQPIASRGDCDLMSIAREGGGWVAECRRRACLGEAEQMGLEVR